MSVIVATLVSVMVLFVSLAAIRGVWQQYGILAKNALDAGKQAVPVRELRFTLTETKSIPYCGRIYVLPVRTQKSRQQPGLRAAA